MVEVFSCGCRAADTHPAFPVAKIENFIDLPVLFHYGVLADDADIGRAVLDIGGDIRAFCQEETQTVLFVGEDQLAGALVLHLIAADAELFKRGHGLIRQTAFCERKGKISHCACPPFPPKG